jgi:hypothetical protein
MTIPPYDAGRKGHATVGIGFGGNLAYKRTCDD